MKPEIDVKFGLGSGWAAAFSALPEGSREMIGIYLVLITLVLFILLVVGGFSVIGKVPELFQGKCWELQFKDDRAFKVNSCNGAVIELDKKTLQPK